MSDQVTPQERQMITGGEFQGHLLNFTPVKFVAAQSMGMLYPNVGEAGFEAWKRSGTYPGQVADVAIFLWLAMEAPGQKARVLMALNKPEAAKLEAIEAAAAMGINVNTPEFVEAWGITARTLEEIRDNKPRAKSQSGNSTEREPDPDPI